jgi:hypothetical protein
LYVRVTNTGQLIDLQRRLRRAGDNNLRRSMQRRIRSAAEPLRDDLKRAVRTAPIRGNGRGLQGTPVSPGRPLRALIAETIRISVNTSGGAAGAKVWSDKGMLPPDLRNMPEKVNSRTWRHPIFGKGWTSSYSKEWWAPAISKNAPRMKRRVERVMDDVTRRLS